MAIKEQLSVTSCHPEDVYHIVSAHPEGLVMGQGSPEDDGREGGLNESADNTSLSSCVHLAGQE